MYINVYVREGDPLLFLHVLVGHCMYQIILGQYLIDIPT